MPTPQFYDDANIAISIDPDAIWREVVGTVQFAADDVGVGIGRVIDIWNGLNLGWVGTTADEAQAFSDAWTGAITELFGTQDDPESAIFTQMSYAVRLAAINYSAVEELVTDMFKGITANLTDTTASTDNGIRDVTAGPLTEHTPR